MRVLILSVGTGHGHNQVGNAIMEHLKAVEKADCTKLDTFNYISPILASSLAEGYLVATKYTPKIYGKVYHLAENRKASDNLSVFRAVNSLLAARLTSFLEDYKPDVTVCTHVFAAQVITMLKNKKLAGTCIGIVTDYTIHPYWEDTDIDYYITPNEELNSQALQKGIRYEKIMPFGIPVYDKFSKKIDQRLARSMLEIEDKTTVLVMGGSMGYGNIIEIIQQLDASSLDFQMLCVCGNNAALKNKIDQLNTRKKVYNYGFVNNIDIMMDASNCIVTKPGGLTVSESLAKELPMILVNPIPGQEERNAQFLCANGVAVFVDRDISADQALDSILGDKNKLDEILKSVRKISRPFASKNVCDLILKHDINI